MQKSLLKNILYLSNAAFIILYIILAWNNRLTADDFYFLNNLHQYGILKGTFMEYNTFSTRWLSVLVVHIVLSLIPYIKALFLWAIFSIIGVTLSFAYLLKNLLLRIFNYHPDKLLLLNLALFGVNTFFYSSIDIGSTWFWLSASPTYLWSFMFFILGCGIIISPPERALWKHIALSASFLYIGGSAEAFASVAILLLMSCTVWMVLFKTSLPDRKVYLTRLRIAFLSCLIAFVVLYMGHGNAVRLGFLDKISFLKAFLLTIGTTGWIGIHWISRILPLTILFSLPLLYAGKLFSKEGAKKIENMQDVRIKLLSFLLLYGVLIFIINYPVTYVLAGIAPARALISVSFLTWALFACSLFYIGYKTAIKEKTTMMLAQLALVLCLLANIYTGIHQFTITTEYAKKYDSLMENLMAHKDSVPVLKIQPLPPSGMLKPLDVDKDSMTNNNVFIKKAMGLKPYIMLTK